MPLVIYKSSAGSGKTTTLVNEYLKITLNNPSDFRHVLAITFTNKAANEMKERILSALEDIIAGNAWLKGEYLPLRSNLKLEENELRNRASRLQYLILHHYDEFSVSTIDSFVHRIIRTFANDVKLPQNFEVVIDSEEIVPDIVNELFQKVGFDKGITDIMVQFVMSMTYDEKSYNLGRPVKEFTQKQLGEDGFKYFQKIKHLGSDEMLLLINNLFSALQKQNQIIINEAAKTVELMESNGLTGYEFSNGKNGIGAYFLKAKDWLKDLPPTVKAIPESAVNEDKWYAKSAKPHIKEIIDALKSDISESYLKIKKEIQTYYYFKLLSEKIYALALTNEIRKIFIDHTDRTQKVHISEFNKRISEEIADQPIPFIYERLGRVYKYFLVDEFQDTSILQWHNLLPLIEESISNNHFSMLVGDAKQAIYRFRNGEVDLFVSLPEIYPPSDSPLQKARERQLINNHRIKVIEENYRSRERIVRFNNDFFSVIKHNFGDRLQKIYRDHKQTVPNLPWGKASGGYVSVELIASENSEDYANKHLDKIEEYVQRLLNLGYAQSDICVLTRTNNDSAAVAAHLLSGGFNVVSPESSLLTKSPAVRYLVSLIQYLSSPSDEIVVTELLRNHFVFNQIALSQHDFYESGKAKAKEGLKSLFSFLGLKVDAGEIGHYPVYEIAEAFAREINPAGQPDVYLQYFLDFVFLAQTTGKTALAEFIEYWQEKKEKSYITLPKGENAIQVMTVHKAKGLKFKVVIVDIIDRRNRKSKSEVWEEVDHPGLPFLHIGLLPMNKSLIDAGKDQLLDEEEQKSKLDFINMVYVAFTRPVDALFLLGDQCSNGKKEEFTKLLVDFLTATEEYNENVNLYEFGLLHANDSKAKKDTGYGETMDKLPTFSWHDKVVISKADEVYWEALHSKPARAYGKLIHAILAGIKSKHDLNREIEKFNTAGTIDDTEAVMIRGVLHKVLDHPDLKGCFDEQAIVRNESELIEQNEDGKMFQRPDRVVLNGDRLIVIDYKTGEQENKHIQQIEHYGKLFEKLGFKGIEKKLVYINGGVEVVDI